MEQCTHSDSEPRTVPGSRPSLGARLLVATLIGGTLGLLCWLGRVYLAHGGAGDFERPIDMATDLLAGRNPYDHPYNFFNLPYPLPAAVCGLPFVWLPKEDAYRV